MKLLKSLKRKLKKFLNSLKSPLIRLFKDGGLFFVEKTTKNLYTVLY
jgi:hypothetical protein